ncbi:MAG: hypothetical protein ACLUIL_14710 [Gallintestinimicrobium sp.]|uniref:hypothetical protein n=1 Tax=Gallintestinimicrobium sp. TaxID=2981655 RepID=UPI0039927B94
MKSIIKKLWNARGTGKRMERKKSKFHEKLRPVLMHRVAIAGMGVTGKSQSGTRKRVGEAAAQLET